MTKTRLPLTHPCRPRSSPPAPGTRLRATATTYECCGQRPSSHPTWFRPRRDRWCADRVATSLLHPDRPGCARRRVSSWAGRRRRPSASTGRLTGSTPEIMPPMTVLFPRGIASRSPEEPSAAAAGRLVSSCCGCVLAVDAWADAMAPSITIAKRKRIGKSLPQLIMTHTASLIPRAKGLAESHVWHVGCGAAMGADGVKWNSGVSRTVSGQAASAQRERSERLHMLCTGSRLLGLSALIACRGCPSHGRMI